MKLVVVLCLLIASAAPVHAADWRMDSSRSKLEFAATYEQSVAPGVFKEFDTRMHFDPDRPGDSTLDVTIAVASADMHSADINKAILGTEWFDAAHFPQADFHAVSVRSLGLNRYVATGMLRLKGIEKPVEVPFAWMGSGDGATMEGRFTIERSLYAIGAGEWASTKVIGPDVAVKFRITLRKHA